MYPSDSKSSLRLCSIKAWKWHFQFQINGIQQKNKGIDQNRHKIIPIPRWVFILAYLAVPVKFLFSLQKIRRKSNLQKIMKVQNDNLEQQKSSSILIFTRIIRKTMQIDDIEIKIKTNYKSLQRNYPNNSCK